LSTVKVKQRGSCLSTVEVQQSQAGRCTPRQCVRLQNFQQVACE
jgi:hypothetical protein